ncbi:MAG: TRAP transporter substrate-binding protein [Rhodobiaceae bacterium]|nr:TRAP transporter substrate-binding protein [Rhodobiaceae bacterium]
MYKNFGRYLMTGFAVAAMATGLSVASAPAQDSIELKVAIFTPEPAPDAKMITRMLKDWEEKSGGRLKPVFFYGSSMGPLPRHHDLVRKGVADIAFFQHGVTPGRFPLTELVHLPYVLPAGPKGAEVGARILGDLRADYLAKEHEGTKILWLATTEPAYIYDSSKVIANVGDLKGRRYRAPTPTVATMLKELGANPIGLPAPLMAESLQKGTIDGVITDPNGVFTFKLGGLVKNETPMFLAVLSFGLVMNEDKYNSLPDDLKKIIDDSVGDGAQFGARAMEVWGKVAAREDYLAKADINKVALDPAADKEMRDLSEKFIEKTLADLEAKGLPGREVYAKMKAMSAEYSK